jgi:hypothetical protein
MRGGIRRSETADVLLTNPEISKAFNPENTGRKRGGRIRIGTADGSLTNPILSKAGERLPMLITLNSHRDLESHRRRSMAVSHAQSLGTASGGD